MLKKIILMAIFFMSLPIFSQVYDPTADPIDARMN